MTNKIHELLKFSLAIWFPLAIVSCSTTSSLHEGEKLYTGMKSTKYVNYDKNLHFSETSEELDLVLAAAPNASLFGSSTYRSPFPIGLWIWNAFANDSTAFARWMTKAFATNPVLLSHVNPELRVTVGENTLRKRGYFNGRIGYETLVSANPKKAKVAYTVDMGHLWTIDTLEYKNFPEKADSIIQTNSEWAYIKAGDPFDVAEMESERARISELFKDNGYYYYQKDFAAYFADTVSNPGKVNLKLQLADDLDEKALKEWYIGDININFRKKMMESLDSTYKGRSFTAHYNGKRMPVRTRVVRNALMFKKNELYSQEKYTQSLKNINSSGLYSGASFTFTPRDTTAECNILDVNLDLLFDKPYDFYVEAYGKGKTSGKLGPELIVGLTKRNAFRGRELLDFNIHGSYEWQTGHDTESSTTGVNSYEYGGDVSLTLPRILNPFRKSAKKRREQRRKDREAGISRKKTKFYDIPQTTIKATASTLNRAHYFRQHVVSGELRYKWRTSAQSEYEFAPLSLTYEYMKSRTDSFIKLQEKHPYLKASMSDQFIPKMEFSYSYHSPEKYLNPISWRTTISEASNVVALGSLALGNGWNDKNKRMFKNPYAQFVKIETNFGKTWQLGSNASIAAHVGGGVIYSYGNSEVAPYTEQFYVGGANSIRAFNVRSIGPGKYRPADYRSSYVEQTGDIKFVANLEYRPKLFGNLYGAVFLDAGNVWAIKDDPQRPGGKFEAKNMFRDMALGTGVGLRYDLDFFIIRLDWGIGLHVPYETGKSGFYNVDSFSDAQALHLAIGLPF